MHGWKCNYKVEAKFKIVFIFVLVWWFIPKSKKFSFSKNEHAFLYFAFTSGTTAETAENGGLAMMKNGQVFCTKCSKTYKTWQSGTQHYNEVHKQNQQATCQICHRIFKNKRSRDNHYSQQHQISATAMKNTAVPRW